jgi:hypothetical protein
MGGQIVKPRQGGRSALGNQITVLSYFFGKQQIDHGVFRMREKPAFVSLNLKKIENRRTHFVSKMQTNWLQPFS